MHPEAITSQAKNFLPKFVAFKDFYLAGGTALALQLGHRVSVDFDWFSQNPILPGFLDAVSRVFAESSLKVEVNNLQELTVLAQGVKITFLHYPFPLKLPPVEWESLKLARDLEIGAMKAYSIGRRAQFKDYVDLYSLLKSGIVLSEIMALAEKKFGDQFNGRLFLEQLVYLGDVAEEPLQFLWPKVGKEKLEAFFQQAVGSLKL